MCLWCCVIDGVTDELKTKQKGLWMWMMKQTIKCIFFVLVYINTAPIIVASVCIKGILGSNSEWICNHPNEKYLQHAYIYIYIMKEKNCPHFF